MILTQGDKVLIVHRRLYRGDNSRYFVGIVDGYADGIAKVTGYTWLRDHDAGQFIAKKDRRTKIFSLQSGTLIVYQLPAKVDMAKLRFVDDEQLNCSLTDGEDLSIDVTESVHASLV